ncbi:MAG TPA: DUF3616 domain-containing protein [Thiobacillaceae bacterium]|nr:DUF3616 domain-containing protein [Thiobacillaceae bacterium]HNF88833.1 DUF3616 domain-containing protein [Thiobacillaceae bacterium]HNH89110.1 DUF3616 domain-containing protein [Thiobacillaceae bacterium]
MTLTLAFTPSAGKKKALRDGLSAVVRVGNQLWLANDESLSLERLTLEGDRAGAHVSFPLADCLDLPAPPDGDDFQEADIEGLDWADGCLWLTGSHSLKRKQPKPGDKPEKARKDLAKLSRDGNRYLLARLPLVEEDGQLRPVRQAGGAYAARLDGDAEGNALTRALADDPHLAPFLALPGKDNGLDIEGLAVAGERLFLGLRGPVLRGWAVILELAPEAVPPDRLSLEPLDGHRPYLKHFLDLDGLGVRDLCRRGDDLLILAGPTLDLDGPVRVLRWPGGARPHREGEWRPADTLEAVLDIPYGRGDDHAEGMSLFSSEAGGKPALLVVYDAASVARKRGEGGILADIFPLPA